MPIQIRVNGGHELSDDSVAILYELIREVIGTEALSAVVKLQTAVQSQNPVDFDPGEITVVRGVLEHGVDPEGAALPPDLLELHRLLGRSHA